jgi:hypothetical protein
MVTAQSDLRYKESNSREVCSSNQGRENTSICVNLISSTFTNMPFCRGNTGHNAVTYPRERTADPYPTLLLETYVLHI